MPLGLLGEFDRLYTIGWLVISKQLRQFQKDKHIAAQSVNEEYRRPRSMWLKRHNRTPRRGPIGIDELLGE